MINFDLLYPKPKKSYGGNDRRDEVITIRTTEKTIKLFKKLRSNPNDPNAKQLTTGQLFEAMICHYNESMLNHFEENNDE